MSTVVQVRPAQRLPQLDNLRTVMVAWIIAGHALLGYSTIGGWPYDEVNEVTFGRVAELVMAAPLGPSALFVVGTFFFLAGMFAPRALASKGPGRFARDRLVRLGLPWLAFMLLLWPLFMLFAYRAAGYPVSFWWTFTHRQPFLDSGQLWFAEILLYFSLGYAAWSWMKARFGRRPETESTPLLGSHLTALVLAVAGVSFLVRLWFPARSTQILDLHLWQWPPCLAMFGLGVAVSPRGWISGIPDRLRRGCGWAVVAAVAVLPVLAIGVGLSNLTSDVQPFLGGWHWQAFMLALIEACLVVAGSIWLVGMAQQRFIRGGKLSEACGRSSYAAFVLQAPVLLTLAIAARPLAVPAEAKGLLVGAFGVLASFWLGWLVVGRTQLGRIL